MEYGDEYEDEKEESQFEEYIRQNLYLDPGNKFIKKDKPFLSFISKISKSDYLQYPKVLNSWEATISQDDHPISVFMEDICENIVASVRAMQGGGSFFNPDDLINEIQELPELIVDRICDQYSKCTRNGIPRTKFPESLMTKTVQNIIIKQTGSEIFKAFENFDDAETELKFHALRKTKLRLRELPVRRHLQMITNRQPYKRAIAALGQARNLLNRPVEEQLNQFEESYNCVYEDISSKTKHLVGDVDVDPSESELLRILMYVMLESSIPKLSALFKYIQMWRLSKESRNEYFELFHQVFRWMQQVVEVDLQERTAKVNSEKLLQPTLIPVLSEQKNVFVMPKKRTLTNEKRRSILRFSRKKFVKIVHNEDSESEDDDSDLNSDSDLDESDLEMDEDEEMVEQERVKDEWKKNQERYSKIDLLVQMMEKKFDMKVLHGKSPFDYNIEHVNREKKRKKKNKKKTKKKKGKFDGLFGNNNNDDDSSGNESDTLSDIRDKFRQYDIKDFGTFQSKHGGSKNYGAFRAIEINEDDESDDGGGDSAGDDWSDMSDGGKWDETESEASSYTATGSKKWTSKTFDKKKKKSVLKIQPKFSNRWEDEEEVWDENKEEEKIDVDEHMQGIGKKTFNTVREKLMSGSRFGGSGSGGGSSSSSSNKKPKRSWTSGTIQKGHLQKMKDRLNDPNNFDSDDDDDDDENEDTEDSDIDDPEIQNALSELKKLSIGKRKFDELRNKMSQQKKFVKKKKKNSGRSNDRRSGSGSGSGGDGDGIGKDKFAAFRERLLNSGVGGGAGRSQPKKQKPVDMGAGFSKNKFAEMQKRLMASGVGGGSGGSSGPPPRRSSNNNNSYGRRRRNDDFSDSEEDEEAKEKRKNRLNSLFGDLPPPPPPPGGGGGGMGVSDSDDDDDDYEEDEPIVAPASPVIEKVGGIFINRGFMNNQNNQESSSSEEEEETQSSEQESDDDDDDAPQQSSGFSSGGVFINRNFMNNRQQQSDDDDDVPQQQQQSSSGFSSGGVFINRNFMNNRQQQQSDDDDDESSEAEEPIMSGGGGGGGIFINRSCMNNNSESEEEVRKPPSPKKEKKKKKKKKGGMFFNRSFFKKR